ncbi:hypothetical protein LLE49_21040 [Alicyclobacillus tolerans]|uniref:hypothetical protein n=1 Tax=Alicyclobacillus tolerans TaxID=90970 RepID=UPI001F3084AE|nr:hypothetical protein [Alicyclobacillus tolerans]MCF8567210.1 hypothetical protein [Alicyclobacillus tolerans]
MIRSGRSTNSQILSFPYTGVVQKVEFPSLDRFIEELGHENIESVRLDVFSESRPSELSFVYYNTLELFVTAQDHSGQILYEYMEPLATSTNTEPRFADEDGLELANRTRQKTAEKLSSAGLHVLGGRYTIPHPSQYT